MKYHELSTLDFLGTQNLLFLKYLWTLVFLTPILSANFLTVGLPNTGALMKIRQLVDPVFFAPPQVGGPLASQ